MGHPEYAIPVYLGILVIELALWLFLPVIFITLLVLRCRLQNREVEWLEEGLLLQGEEVPMNYQTLVQSLRAGG